MPHCLFTSVMQTEGKGSLTISSFRLVGTWSNSFANSSAVLLEANGRCILQQNTAMCLPRVVRPVRLPPTNHLLPHLTEALAADVHIILPNQASLVRANAAFARSLAILGGMAFPHIAKRHPAKVWRTQGRQNGRRRRRWAREGQNGSSGPGGRPAV